MEWKEHWIRSQKIRIILPVSTQHHLDQDMFFLFFLNRESGGLDYIFKIPNEVNQCLSVHCNGIALYKKIA